MTMVKKMSAGKVAENKGSSDDVPGTDGKKQFRAGM